MMRVAILTAMGTSLLTNINRIQHFEFSKDLTKIPHHAILNFIKQKHKEGRDNEISAEINSTLQILELLKRENKNVSKIHLILSDTSETQKEIPYLKNYFANLNIQVKETIIHNLKYKESQFKLSGLRSLVDQLTDLINQYEE